MNEVRDIISRMMEDPAPPPRPADEVLAVARRAHRRRSWAMTAGSGALALVMTVGVGVAVRSLLPAPPPTASPSSPHSSVLPYMSARPAHGAVMAERIVASLPASMRAGRVETFSDATEPATVTAPSEHAQILAAALVHVVVDGGPSRPGLDPPVELEGDIFAYVAHDGSEPPDDPCAEVGDDCKMMTVGGVTVRVVSGSDGRRARVVATRFLPGGQLVVGASLAPTAVVEENQAAPPLLPLVVLDARILAGLAADPAMLPA